MNIVYLNDATIADGRAAFEQYTAAMMCGPGTAAYNRGLARQTGIGMIVGAIEACIDRGLEDAEDIVYAVAKSTLCKRSTVRTVFYDLAYSDDDRYERWDRIISIFVYKEEQKL